MLFLADVETRRRLFKACYLLCYTAIILTLRYLWRDVCEDINVFRSCRVIRETYLIQSLLPAICACTFGFALSVENLVYFQ